jgi:hypothetical protein
MKVTTVLVLVIGLAGLVSWSIVGKYRRAWGAESGVTYICKRLIAEKNAEGWVLVFSQVLTIASGTVLLFLVNFI